MSRLDTHEESRFMARKADILEPVLPGEEHIDEIDVSNEMQTSYLEYAYSVIYARALPDARDGLKPVQRRILFQMSQMGLLPSKGHVKSARVVGDVMGRLHPHGDSAIYDALVRLAQDFSLRLPLVDGHGNFGSLDDGPAASRYTEARMAPAALAMTEGLDEDEVDFVPNYDNQLTQPSVLPSAFPNLLVNGASGIAVGMATNMAPHNVGEVVAGARYLLEHPDATLDDIMRLIPGPDLPGGGKIVGLDGIHEAYETGRGIFRTRATARIENVTARRKSIIVTELPYLVGPEKVIEKIKDAVQSGKLKGVSFVADLTDRTHGLRLQIDVKNGFNPEAVLEQLYKLTPMEDSFGINNVALVGGQPQTLGLLDMLRVYLEHRLTVVRRRSEYRLARRNERLHLVEGLLCAIADIDEVIQVIRTSDDAAAAKTRLISVFDLSEVQADYILELRLRRLTKFSKIELEAEADTLKQEIAELMEILASPDRLRTLVSDELAQVAVEYGTPRRTVLLEDAGTSVASLADVPLEVEDAPCWVMLSGTGLIARTSSGDQPPREGERAAHDVVIAQVPSSARGDIAAITSHGRALRLSCLSCPALPPTQGAPSLAGGVPVGELLPLDPQEHVVGIMPIGSIDAAEPAGPSVPAVLTLGTADGVVKRVAAGDVPAKSEWDVIALHDGDEVVGAAMSTDADHCVFLTTEAQLLHFEAGLVRPQGRAAGGMAGVKLPAGARVIFFGVVATADFDTALVATVAGSSASLPGTEAGAAKVTPLAAYPSKGRATGGVRAQRFLRGQDTVIAGWSGPSPARACGGGGQPIDLPEMDERRDASGMPLAAPVAALG